MSRARHYAVLGAAVVVGGFASAGLFLGLLLFSMRLAGAEFDAVGSGFAAVAGTFAGLLGGYFAAEIAREELS